MDPGAQPTARRGRFPTILGGAGVFGAYVGGPNAITQRENVYIYIFHVHITYHII